MAEAVRARNHGKQPVGDPQALTMDEVEFRLVGEAMIPREPAARDGWRGR
jgi:hypothetical protein